MLPVAWSALLAVLLLWPQRSSGYGLGHDLVFTPRQPLSWASVGLGSSSPRAVPLDAVVGTLSKIADGAIIGRIALLAPLLLAGIGAARVVGHERLPGAFAASGFAIWNPYVIERLALGQWALLLAYAALPWLVLAGTRLREEGTGLAPLLLWVALASMTPTGGVIAAVVAAVVSAPRTRTGWRRWLAVPAGAALLQLPWVLPAVAGSAHVTSDPAGVAAFAARAEHSGGVLLSLLGTGGIWDADVVPGSRDGPLAFAGLAVTLAAALLGWPRLVQLLGVTTVLRLAACAAAGLVLAAAASVPGLDAGMRWIVRTLPGGGLLRDAQKWLAPYAMLVALLAGAAVARLALSSAWRAAVAAFALAGPLLLLPDAMRTVHTTVEPVRYPQDWSWARDDVGHGGDVAVLPFQSYRRFPWAPGRTVIDPTPRLLPGAVVVSDQLAVSGRVLYGEDERARRVAVALRAGAALPGKLAAAGIGWVLVERDTPGDVPDLHGLPLVREGRNLALYRVPGAVHASGPTGTQIGVVLAGDVAALCLVAAAAASLVLGRTRMRVEYRLLR